MERFREPITPTESPASIPLSFPRLLTDSAHRHGHRIAFSDRAHGFVRELSFTECLFWSNEIAHRLTTLSKSPRCVIYSESRIEWPAVFFGILGAGGVVVPCDSRSTAHELAEFLRTIQATVLMVSPKLLAAAEEAMVVARWHGTVMLMSLNDQADARAISALEKAPCHFALTERSDNDVAIIATTAGTCGDPRAVQLSFGSIFHQMHSLREALVLTPGDAMLSLLPLSDIVEMTCNLLTAFVNGCHVHFPRTLLPTELKGAMKQWKITHAIVVPRLLQAAEDLIKSRFKAQYGAEGTSRMMAMQDISRATGNSALRRHLNRSILNVTGPYLRKVLVCGATLNTDTLKFFHFIGIDILQSYGLVECCGLATVNLRNARFGSVGQSLPGCSIRIAATGETNVGEILIRGPHLLSGFVERENLVAPIDGDGWLHTGDCGFLSHDGFLYVMDRKARIIVLEDGSEVYPREVEKMLSNSKLFDQVCVTGLNHGKAPASTADQVCAVVVPNIGLRKRKSLNELQVLCEKEVSQKTSSLPEFKRPQRIIVRMLEMPVTRTGVVKVTP